MKSTINAFLKVIIPEKHWPKFRQLTKKLQYFGLRYKCPICDSNLSRFDPFGFSFPVLAEKKVIGGGYRLNARCPVCRSLDRARLLYLYLTKNTSIFTEQVKLLHVAPEVALSAIFKKNANVDYLTADLNSKVVMVKMDITGINYPDNSFDVVICNHVLEHIVDDRKAMNEIFRVLKPGGWGILQVPMSFSLENTYEDFSVTTPSEREEFFGQSDHVRIYAIDYLDRLKEAEFQVNTFKWWTNEKEFASSNNKFGLIQDEMIFHVTKPE